MFIILVNELPCDRNPNLRLPQLDHSSRLPWWLLYQGENKSLIRCIRVWEIALLNFEIQPQAGPKLQ
jgi:hypothetical protein